MVVVSGILKICLCKRREHEHGDWTIWEPAVFGFVPEDEQHPVFRVDLGTRDGRYPNVLKPRISPQRVICRFIGITRGNTFVPVMTQVWRNEVILRVTRSPRGNQRRR